MTKFQQAVFAAVQKIPYGKVATYRQIAIKIGSPNACRAVGNALHNNTAPIVIPCHRVVNSQGKASANFAFGGEVTQLEWLEKEGIVVNNGVIDLSVYLCD